MGTCMSRRIQIERVSKLSALEEKQRISAMRHSVSKKKIKEAPILDLSKNQLYAKRQHTLGKKAGTDKPIEIKNNEQPSSCGHSSQSTPASISG
ncbi:unnamed protein product [Blepharisma stoltei]|uniref:Lipoxygenase domain-containing protein n=1 Tax=Blepharisma stoltei TaxID=1481888 RepID=A0AAU9K8V6_9CILI|nr:unnamed protein product [Blepharisma stoltei]